MVFFVLVTKMGTSTMIIMIMTIIMAKIKPISSLLNFSVEMGFVFVVISGCFVATSGSEKKLKEILNKILKKFEKLNAKKIRIKNREKV